MRTTQEILHGDTRIVVKELTLAEIRVWLFESESKAAPDLVGALLFEDCQVSELGRFCDATPEQIEGMTQSELRELRDAAKALNPDFFAMRARLLELAGRLPASSSSVMSAP